MPSSKRNSKVRPDRLNKKQSSGLNQAYYSDAEPEILLQADNYTEDFNYQSNGMRQHWSHVCEKQKWNDNLQSEKFQRLQNQHGLDLQVNSLELAHALPFVIVKDYRIEKDKMGISGESKIIPNKAKTKEKKSEYYFPLRKQTEVGKKINAGNAYTVSLRTRNTEQILNKIEQLNKRCEEEDNRRKEINKLSQNLRRPIQRQSKPKEQVQGPAISTARENQKGQAQVKQNAEQRKFDDSVSYLPDNERKKIKRQQIQNRYHYNPYEEDETEDSCELWRRLMRKQIDIVISNPRESINCYVSELLEARQISERSPSEKREFNFFENYNDDYFLSVDRPQQQQSPEQVVNIKQQTEPNQYRPFDCFVDSLPAKQEEIEEYPDNNSSINDFFNWN